MNNLLEIYTDYLISSFSQATATNLSRLLEGEISHDKITRFLSQSYFSSSYLWLSVKSAVREVEKDDGFLIFDDTLIEKPYTDENDIGTKHFDHSKGRTVKGINILNAIYNVADISLPVAFEIINKPIHYCDIETRYVPHRRFVTKNDLLLQMLKTWKPNQLHYRYVLTDIWIARNENMQQIKIHFKKDFIMAMKSNRLVALSLEEKKKGRFVKIDSLDEEQGTTKKVYLKGLDFPVLLTKQVFKNKDDSQGTLYLVSRSSKLTYDEITTIYQKRLH